MRIRSRPSQQSLSDWYIKKKLPLCEKPTVKDKEILVHLLQNKKLLLSITRLAGTSMMNMPKTPPPSV